MNSNGESYSIGDSYSNGESYSNSELAISNSLVGFVLWIMVLELLLFLKIGDGGTSEDSVVVWIGISEDSGVGWIGISWVDLRFWTKISRY